MTTPSPTHFASPQVSNSFDGELNDIECRNLFVENLFETNPGVRVPRFPSILRHKDPSEARLSSSKASNTEIAKTRPNEAVLKLLVSGLNTVHGEHVCIWARPETAFVNKLSTELTCQLEETMIIPSFCLPDWDLDLPSDFPFLFLFATRGNPGNLVFGILRDGMTTTTATSKVLEDGYFEEVEIGLGPTPEFYALVSEEFARKDLRDADHIPLGEAIKADHGFNPENQAIRDLVEILSEYDPSTRRNFLQFITGCPKLPIGGFRGVNPQLTVVRKPHEAPLTADD
ncbi:hypothetical protein BDP27DRAFT_1401416 [Rhodocollybia butyracea]|uniref:HECT domain-containing protein n=1 Tax=Rhodocollybia butyracea TaxID=206335 RepID=A0A9P5PYI4_9AGAR|nr:hypothetical protein BDP27DRAFT_1401416 [Rhodocollybia butyracea]